MIAFIISKDTLVNIIPKLHRPNDEVVTIRCDREYMFFAEDVVLDPLGRLGVKAHDNAAVPEQYHAFFACCRAQGRYGFNVMRNCRWYVLMAMAETVKAC